MELLMENKAKVMNNYLLNLKFKVSKKGLKMLFHDASIRTIYCIIDIICNVTCQETEVVRFLGSFPLYIFLNSRSHYQIRSTGFPKQKTSFLPPR